MSRFDRKSLLYLCAFAVTSLLAGCTFAAAQVKQSSTPLTASVDARSGSFSLDTSDRSAALHGAAVAAKVDRQWLRAADYGTPAIVHEHATGELGEAQSWTVTYSGASGKPDLIYRLRLYANAPFADIQATVRNSTAHAITVQDIRSLELAAPSGIQLGGPEAEDRVLSDSFSEDRPEMKIHDLGDASNQLHRGVGSQLLYNRKSGESLFAGALTSDRFLTILRIHLAGTAAAPQIAAYEADSAGTQELTREYSLSQAPPKDQVELSVTVDPGKELQSERLLVSLDRDYHRQLETYGSLIRDLHHARVTSPAPMGWWSWTAYYADLDETKARANEEWLAKNLKGLGYNVFHIDEGYSVARGDYLTPNMKLFSSGVGEVEKKAAALGLMPAIWTAPFEVSDRSWVYWNHPEWLVRNDAGKPIRLTGADSPDGGRLYVLDPTHPGAQQYLRKTYSTITKEWGVQYIKLDFMEDSCIEGTYYRPGTTALEAQRIGLEVIRSAVGDSVLLDKDGSVMLNPVGIVDIGRVSQDTGHNFKTIKASATGIAARYFMNRKFFVADPDAFMVTAGEGENRFNLEEAKASIALSAVSGGMMEVGNDLPSLDAQPERLALIENPRLLAMARLGKAAVPVDLMSYLPEDLQPSIFFLGEDERSSVLTVFNWSDSDRAHSIALDALGLKADRSYRVEDFWDGKEIQSCRSCVLDIRQGAHSVRMFKITEVPESLKK